MCQTLYQDISLSYFSFLEISHPMLKKTTGFGHGHLPGKLLRAGVQILVHMWPDLMHLQNALAPSKFRTSREEVLEKSETQRLLNKSLQDL